MTIGKSEATSVSEVLSLPMGIYVIVPHPIKLLVSLHVVAFQCMSLFSHRDGYNNSDFWVS